MGYQTLHKLKVNGGTSNEHEKAIAELAGYDEYLFDDEENRWYEHEADMKKYSLQHPGDLFEVTGYGEEAGDIWREFYKNGKMCGGKATIVLPEFNEQELK